MRQQAGSGSPWEDIVGYSRAVRVGNIIEVAGTTAMDGETIVGEGDVYAQTKYIFEKIEKALQQLGGSLKDVVRTRMFVINITDWELIGKAHGELFNIYKQMRRGKVITYGRPMGMTRVDLADAMEYLFIGSTLPTHEREATFSCGKHMEQNFYQIFKEEINSQNAGIQNWLGADRVLPKSPVSGSDLMNLSYEGVRFTSVNIVGIGKVTVKHDPSLDYRPGEDRFISGMHQGGLAHTTYSAVIWDTASQIYSNNRKLPQGATLVDGGDNKANMYLVKPDGAMTTFGSEIGRVGGEDMGYSDLISSSRSRLRSWWIYSSVAGLVLDKSRFVIIELDESVEAGFN